MAHQVYIAMGSNLGDRRANIQGGLNAANTLKGTQVVRCSSIIETDPVGPSGQGAYLNCVALLETTLDPESLLNELLNIETRFGRDRASEVRWGARTLDLDILVFGDQEIDQPGLTIPHPRLHTRSFVLIPLCEIAPGLRIPRHKKTPREMLGALESSDC